MRASGFLNTHGRSPFLYSKIKVDAQLISEPDSSKITSLADDRAHKMYRDVVKYGNQPRDPRRQTQGGGKINPEKAIPFTWTT